MCLRLLKIFAFVNCFFCLANSWHADAGPWVRPTQGEVWPLPNNIVSRSNSFYILQPSNFEIRVSGETCDVLTDAIERYTEIIFKEACLAKLAAEGKPPATIRGSSLFKGTLEALNINLKQPCSHNDEHWPSFNMSEEYAIDIRETSTMAQLSANSVWGVLRGLETFSQLLFPSGDGPTLKVKCQMIRDTPMMAHRGLLIDTSRHYLPLADILLTLDAMSYNKLNVLHWHIVDDNSFPYQSARYPDLSAKGAFHPSMVYTIHDIQKVVNYARLRGIRVMPEFDSPGHTRSWGLAYPEFLTTCYDSAGKPNGKLGPMNPLNLEVYEFLQNLFSEIVQVFPDQYIHLGGDEVPFDCWASNPEIIAYMKAHNMSQNFSRLEGEFVAKLLQIVDSLKAKSIVWQEVFDNRVALPVETIIHVWTGNWQKELEKVTKAGHPVLLSACWYLDHLASGGDWKKFYNCNPRGFNDGSKTNLMLGGEACMWGEFVDRTNVHPRIWPRASAAAERLWTYDAHNIKSVEQRLEEHACRMNKRGIPTQPPNGPGICVL